MELSSLVSYGDTTPLNQLRRAQLWQLADKHGIQYPHDATKEQMISLFEGAQVDVTKPENGIQWQLITGRDARGQPSQYVAPVIPEHQSSRHGVDSSALLQQRLEAAEEKERKTQDKNDAQAELIGSQRDEIRELKEALGKVMDRLDGMSPTPVAEPETAPLPPPSKSSRGAGLARYRELKAACKAKGIEVKKGMKTADLEAALKAQ